MQIALSSPVTIPVVQTTEVSTSAVTVKIQPLNREVHIRGAEYAAIRDAFSGPLASAFAPAIKSVVEAAAPQPEL